MASLFSECEVRSQLLASLERTQVGWNTFSSENGGLEPPVQHRQAVPALRRRQDLGGDAVGLRAAARGRRAVSDKHVRHRLLKALPGGLAHRAPLAAAEDGAIV